MYSDPEGNTPYKVKFQTLPQFGVLSYDGIAVTIGQVLDYTTEVGNGKLIYESDLSKLEGHSVNFNFRVSDIGSELYSNVGVITINVKKQQIPPTVSDNFDLLTTNKYLFKLIDFTKDYADLNLDPYLKLVIEDLIGAGFIKYNNIKVTAGTNIMLSDINKLTFTLPDEYTIIDGVLYMYDNDLDTILLQYEAAGYFLDSNEEGLLIFRKQGVSYLTKEVRGEEINNSALSFHFSVIEDSEFSLKSNEATFSLIPQGNVNVAEPYINQPPTVGNLNFDIEHGKDIEFTAQDYIENTFPKYFDIEGDSPVNLMIISLPTNGELFYKGILVTLSQVIPVDDINTLRYVSNINNTTPHQDEFTFKISDSGSNSYSNLGRIIINIAEKVATPPTIIDSSGQLVSNQYDFIVNNFTNQFTDLDGDSYNETKIETLPPVGSVQYNGVNLGIGDAFPLIDINNVKYILPDSYMLTPNGYCEFDKSIDTIISDQTALGFSLINKTAGRLEFEKANITRVPNNTDIYAFFDTTSMKIEDAQAAQTILLSWYNTFITDNDLFTGNLYILPVFVENWLAFPQVILRGSYAVVGNNPDRPNDDYMSFSQIPVNFDIDTNDTNPNWIIPESVLVLAFVDEVATGNTNVGNEFPVGNAPYHSELSSDGFLNQPTGQYLYDYKRFVDNYNEFGFFRGVLYPIPNIEAGSYNNLENAGVLQGFAAIEGGATYSLPEIEALGVIFAEERRFHWHLDPNHPNYSGTSTTVANPYSAEANTLVTGTSYNLEGLKNYGWQGVYDKNQPASSVFTPVSFSNELSKFLQGSETSTVERKVIEGICTSNVNICFDFRTSDNSTFNFFSNIATFCLSPSYENTPPTVDDNSVPLRIEKYTFNTTSFTKNFSDAEGDTANQVIIKSYPNTAGLKLLGMDVQIGDSFSVVNSNNLTFDLNDRYAIYGGVIYDFKKSIQEIIDDYLIQGYVLDDNSNGTLTFVEKGNEANRSVVRGTVKSNSTLCFNFATTDSSLGNMESNIATFCLIPEGNINIKTIDINNPPTIGDNRLSTYYNKAIIFKRADFIEETTPVYKDPENDAPFMLKILSLPVNGILKFDGINVNIGDEFAIADIAQERLTYVPDSTRTDIQSVDFNFTVSDIGSKTYAP